MKVTLSVAENWARLYQVKIPDNTPREKWDAEAITAYLKWIESGAEYGNDTVQSYGEPEYIDDGPNESFFVTGVIDE